MENKEFIYCGNRKCPKEDCLRYWKNEPFNVLIKEEKFTLDRAGRCEMYASGEEEK